MTPVASLIAHVAFWFLLGYGYAWGEIRARGAAVFVTLWIIGLVAASSILDNVVSFFSLVAILDIALVFVVFKGDLPIT